MTAIAHPRTSPLAPAPRVATGMMLRPRPDADDGHERRAEPTPLFTRHMLGAIEVERDQRRQRRGRSGTGRAERRRPAARAVHPRLTAAAAASTTAAAASVRMQRPDLDRWTDDGGSMIVESSRGPRIITTPGAE
jgi:hypothetical protein